MKLTKQFKASHYNLDVDLKLKINTKNLTQGESHREFNYIVDRIIKALMDEFSYNQIKEVKN